MKAFLLETAGASGAALAAVVFASAAARAEDPAPAETPAPVVVSPVYGAGIGLPCAAFAPSSALPGWRFVGASDGLEPDAGGWRAFRMRAGNDDGAPVLAGRARFSAAPGGAVRGEWRLVPSAAADVLETCVAADVPSSIVGGGRAVLDGEREIALALDGAKPHLFRGPVSRFSLFGKDGAEVLRVAFDRPTRVLLQDGAHWGNPVLTLRLFFAEGPLEGGREYAVDATFAAPAAGPLEPDAGGVATIEAGPDWIPLRYDPWIEPGSALDFSAVVPHHAPAGRFGRVVAVGDHFEFEGLPGVPQRFYGANLCFGANIPPSREAADRFAANFARVGYNAVRIHHHERALIDGDGRPRPGRSDVEPAPEPQARFDDLVAACVENGVYLTTDLYVSRSSATPWRAIGIDRDGTVPQNDYKILVVFHEPAYSNLCAWTRNFLGHVNPRTGRSLAEEPALATLALVNEGNLGNWGGGPLRELPGVADAWRAWLAAKAGDPAFAGIPDTIPDSLYSAGGDSAVSRHAAAFAVFLAERETAFFERFEAFVRDECGCKAPLSSLSSWYDPEQYQLPRTRFDYVDDHFYVDHPDFLDRPWRLPSRCANVNPVAGPGAGARDVAWRRLMDKPFCLTEWNYSAPGRYRGAGGVVTGALGARQDWDGMWRFAWSHGRDGIESPGGPIRYFDMAADPLGLAAERAALCLFLRRDLAPLAEARPAVLREEELLDPRHGAPRLPGPDHPLALAWTRRVGTIVAPCTGDQSHAEAAEDAEAAEPADDGAVRIDSAAGTFLVDTPRTAGGFAEGGRHDAGPLSFAIDGAVPASVWVSSLDGEPIASSRRLLLAHLTDVQNSGARFGDRARTILLDWGRLPHLMRRGAARIELALAPGSAVSVYRLASNGARLAEVPATFENGRLSFEARTDLDPNEATCLYEIARSAAAEPQEVRTPEPPPPAPAFTMRIDDNKPAQWWRDVCGIFERHGFRCSLAVNAASLSESQGACLRELAARGHEIMDHTPIHSIDSIIYPDQASFERASRLPFAHDADPGTRRVFFDWEADDDDERNVTFRAKVVDGELVPAGDFAGKRPPARFFKLPGRPDIFGYKEEGGRFLLRDFWRRPPAETIRMEECDVLGYSGWALHPCDGLLRELASVTRERFDHFGIPRPTVWIFPGGWCGPVRQDAMERVYGGEFGYIGADAQLGPAKCCEGRWFAAYNSMTFFDGDSTATPEDLVGKIEARLASGKSHVTLSHMQTRDIQGFLEKTERFAALLEERKVPVLTMGESIESRFGGDGRGRKP